MYIQSYDPTLQIALITGKKVYLSVKDVYPLDSE